MGVGRRVVSYTVADVRLWGTRVGAVRWDPDRGLADYEFDPVFVRSGIELAPLRMPLGQGVWSFPSLSRDTFKGLPGMLADALPDKFGTALMDTWLVSQGRAVQDFNPVERLCYVGSRAMGALEFAPAADTGDASNSPLDMGQLVSLAQKAIAPKAGFVVTADDHDAEDLSEIFRVDTSAGGAQAKAVIAWNEQTGEIRSGRLDQPDGFTHWLLKFDRVDGGRLHMQTLTALAHFDFNLAGGHSYEQALQVMRLMRLPNPDLVEQFRRGVFNVVARNQDDHTENISFLMDRTGEWSLSPAYDITYSYNPAGAWTSSHQMTLNGKRSGFERADIAAFATAADLTEREGMRMLDQIRDVVAEWPSFAAEAGLVPAMTSQVESNLRVGSLALQAG